MATLVIGTRGSPLALVQANWVAAGIAAHYPGVRISTRIITTSADRDTRTSIRSASSTGVFVREIEEALLRREIDLAVHSMKDLPTMVPDALTIGAIPAREDARDALIVTGGRRTLQDLPAGAVVGTGSIRRQAQILARRPDLRVRDIRGNVGTRLQKLDAGGYDAIVLACAGLNRLQLHDCFRTPLEFTEMLPATCCRKHSGPAAHGWTLLPAMRTSSPKLTAAGWRRWSCMRRILLYSQAPPP